MRSNLSSIKSNHQVRDGMYSQGNSILKSMHDEINDLRNNKEDLDKDIALLSGMDESTKYYEDSLRAAREERDGLQR